MSETKKRRLHTTRLNQALLRSCGMPSPTLQKKCLAVGLALMLLVFLLNLHGSLGVYIMERYENAGRGLTALDPRPQAIHLAFSQHPTQAVTVLFASRFYYSRARVLYGLAPSSFHSQVYANCQKITKHNSYGMHYWYRAELTGLKAGTRYHYQVLAGSGGSSSSSSSSRGSSSEVYQFRTAPRRSDGFTPHFLVFGDLGMRSRGLKAILKEGESGGYDAALHLGDIAYDLRRLQGLTGDSFLRTVEPLAARLPYMTAVGDHESPFHFFHYRFRFSMPGAAWPMREERLWYSLDLGNVHLISYNTEAYFHSTPANVAHQFRWLVDDLQRATRNRRRVPWLIVMGHKPLYCSQVYAQDCNRPNSRLRQGVEELFYTFGVDLVLQGHCHSYERSWPMYQGRPAARHYRNPQAPVYLTTGTTGNQYITDTVLPGRQSPWSAFLMSETEKESFGRLRILNDTHLHWEAVLTSDSSVIDSFTLFKNEHRPKANLDEFIRRARASSQTMEQLLLGQNLSVAQGDFSGWRSAAVMMFAFAVVLMLILFRAAVVEMLDTGVQRLTHGCRQLYKEANESPSQGNSAGDV